MSGKGTTTNMVGSSSFPGTGPDVDLSRLSSPTFIVTVDTEEEFDWSGEFTRDRHGLLHLPKVARFQELCEGHGVKPTYLVDYPVANNGFGAELFGDWAKRGVAEVGLQLHPWVNPPFDEEVNLHHSYASNLPAELERAKLFALYEIVEKRIGVAAQSYRAGRYGAGARTPDLLTELGVKVDSSVRSLFDYRGQGGPDYARCPLTPYWVKKGQLIELPVTSVFGGAFRSIGPLLFDKVFASETMRAVLARSAMLERIALTPEGFPVDKALVASDLALEAKLPVLTFSFHSPSLAAGYTPYVRCEEELENFYIWWETVFAHLRKREVAPTSIEAIAAAVF